MDKTRLFWWLFGFTILVIIGMQITGAPLKTEAAPAGIVTFELIGSFSGSQLIIQSWQGQPMIWAGINMGLDFLFLALYSITIALACLIIVDRFNHIEVIKRVGLALAAGIFVAAALDIMENIALIRLLVGSVNEQLPRIARWSAIPKFSLVLLSLVYVLVGSTVILYKKIIPKRG